MGDNEEFDWDAFMGDTIEASSAAAGAWLRVLYKMKKTGSTGRLSLPIQNYANLFGMTVDEARGTIDEIIDLKIGDAVEAENVSVTKRNTKITLENRRMRKRFLEREANKHRQSEFRARQARGERNGNVANGDKNAVVVEDLNLNKKEKKLKQRVPTSRIPDPFPLTDEMIEWAADKCPGLRVIEAHENFIEYWTNNTTAKAEKVDWKLTWQKGMKMAANWQRAEVKTVTNGISNREMIAREQAAARAEFAQ